MGSSTSKKVVAIRFDREPVNGFVSPQTWLQPEGIEVLTAAGTISSLPYDQVKAVCFVRDFYTGDGWKPNRAFVVRPKSEGLWVRFVFRDDDTIDGLVPSDLLALEPAGFTITPPEATSFAPRVWLPKAAVREAIVLGVIGAAAATRRERKKKVGAGQLEMFDQ